MKYLNFMGFINPKEIAFTMSYKAEDGYHNLTIDGKKVTIYLKEEVGKSGKPYYRGYIDLDKFKEAINKAEAIDPMINKPLSTISIDELPF